MTIQTINTGTTANDGTGDDPRTAGSKINDNFTNSTHAASRDVGTATGQIPDADDLNIVGNTNYTSGNLNTHKFGGVGGNRSIGIGFAQSSTAIVLALPINEMSTPSSITITGTFTIQTLAFATLHTGVVPTASMSGSNNKVAIILFLGLSGLTTGSPYYIRTDGATDRIEVSS